jgi:hypothetical protein
LISRKNSKVLIWIVSLPLVAISLFFLLFWTGIWFGRDTYYSRGFVESEFSKVRQGMTRAEVEALVGPGLCGDPDYKFAGVECFNRELTMYSFSPADTHYDRRWIYYIDDRVSSVVRELYVD